MSDPLLPLESELARLPEPEPPAGLADGVMARVARVDAGRIRQAPARQPRSRAAPAAAERSVRSRDHLAPALGAAGLVAYVYGLAQGDWTFSPLVSPIGEGMTVLVGVPASVPAALGLTAALFLYLAGLLAPLGRR